MAGLWKWFGLSDQTQHIAFCSAIVGRLSWCFTAHTILTRMPPVLNSTHGDSNSEQISIDPIWINRDASFLFSFSHYSKIDGLNVAESSIQKIIFILII
jgi:hypothetical protein